ncbi:7890_t:CDS:2, partial [Dentiscutata erythropus]
MRYTFTIIVIIFVLVLSTAWIPVTDASCQAGVRTDSESCEAGELCGLIKPGSRDCKEGLCVQGRCQLKLRTGCVVGGLLNNWDK